MTETPRPRKRRKEARPAEIIEAGLEEFALHGLAGARMEDVAQRAGIAKGTIYRYFEDKESLFIAAVRARVPLLDGTIELFIDAFPGKSADLLRLFFARAYLAIENPQTRVLMRILIAEGARFPALTELYHREVISRGRRRGEAGRRSCRGRRR
jgi:AcrR family transcriptional regulator